MARPLTLSAIDGGISRLRTKGGANKDALYDLLNGYVTNAGTVKVRPGTFRNVNLAPTTGPGLTKGLVAYQSSMHVFSHEEVPVPSGYTLHVLNHPASTQVSAPAAAPFGAQVRPYTVPSLLLTEAFPDTDLGSGGMSWSYVQTPFLLNTILDPFGSYADLVYIDQAISTSAYILGTGLTGADFTDGTKDWTIEFWYYPTDPTAGSGGGGKTLGLFDFSNGSTTFGYLYANGHQVTFQHTGSTWPDLTVTGAQLGLQGSDQWNHIALVKTGNMLRLYVNGQTSSTGIGNTNGSNGGSIGIVNYVLGNLAGTPASTPANGYFSNFRITFGRAVYALGKFFCPSAPLTTTVTFPYSAASLQHYESSSPTFLDSVIGAETWTAGGSGGVASQSSTQAKFGTQSLTFSGTDCYISAPLLKSGILDFVQNQPDCTFDFWVYSPTASPGSTEHLIQFTGGSPPVGLTVDLLTSGKIRASFDISSGGSTTVDTASAITANAWHHVAVVVYGSTVMIFLDGAQGATHSFFDHGNFPTSANNAYIGTQPSSGAGFNGGYIDEFRVTIGMALWITSFTAPAAPDTSQTISAVPIKEIHFAAPFLGFLYVVAEFQPDSSGLGSVFHYWLQNEGAWTTNKDYRIGDVVTPTVPNGLLFTASRSSPPNPVWTANIQHARNDVVEPTVPNGFEFTATAVQGANPTSGNTEPVWPTSDGGTVIETSQLANDQSVTLVQTAPQPAANAPSTSVQKRYANIAGGFKAP